MNSRALRMKCLGLCGVALFAFALDACSQSSNNEIGGGGGTAEQGGQGGFGGESTSGSGGALVTQKGSGGSGGSVAQGGSGGSATQGGSGGMGTGGMGMSSSGGAGGKLNPDAGAVGGIGGSAATSSRSIFISSGDNIARMYSRDGLTWSAAMPGAQVFPGEENYADALAIGNGVAVAGAGKGVMRSTDGITWTPQTGPSIGGGVGTWFIDQFVFVVGEKTFTSNDGLQWKAHTLPGGGWKSPDWAQHWHGMASGNGHLVAVGDRNCFDNSGEIKVSEDGFSWHDFLNAGYGWGSVVFGNGVFLARGQKCAAGSINATARSTDGAHWTIVEDTAAPVIKAKSFVVFAGGLFVACGTQCFTSPDGITWTASGSAPAGVDVFAFANGIYFGRNWESKLWTSTDHNAWEQHPKGDFRQIVFGELGK
jgi:hypothetical protein